MKYRVKSKQKLLEYFNEQGYSCSGVVYCKVLPNGNMVNFSNEMWDYAGKMIDLVASHYPNEEDRLYLPRDGFYFLKDWLEMKRLPKNFIDNSYGSNI